VTRAACVNSAPMRSGPARLLSSAYSAKRITPGDTERTGFFFRAYVRHVANTMYRCVSVNIAVRYSKVSRNQQTIRPIQQPGVHSVMLSDCKPLGITRGSVVQIWTCLSLEELQDSSPVCCG
jgi:hypothetical protein